MSHAFFRRTCSSLSLLLLLPILLPGALALYLDDSTPSNVLTQSFKLDGSASKFHVDVYGLSSRDLHVILVLRGAFRHLADVWSSKVPVTTRITFMDLGRPESLASGSGVLFVRIESSPDKELMPIAAAEAITGRNLNGDERGLDKYDVLIKMNRRTSWHVNVKTKPKKNMYDMYTVVLHEAYHNILFSGTIAVDDVDGRSERGPTAKLLDGYPARFDLFLANERGCAVLDYRNDWKLANSIGRAPAHLLAQAVTNDRLFFYDGTSGTSLPLYSPLQYQSQSSIYHIDSDRREGTAGVMNRYIPSGYMQRTVNKEILCIQEAFLNPDNPDNRGAKHCRMPLSDPAPDYLGNDSHLATGPSFSGEGSQFSAPAWVIGISFALTILVSIPLFLCCSHCIVRRSRPVLEGKLELTSDARDGGLGRRFSEASTDMLIDHGVSLDKIEIDVRDLEIDEEDFRLFEYRIDDSKF